MANEEYEQIKFRNELIRLHAAEPFVPFEIILSSGDRVAVTEAMALVLSDDVLE
ncbi:MAG: hypothetical protein H7144_10710 [Burkholderiales bacterium]|nr:hypothetical protein [Phycisphaerae bacterium]